MAAPVCRTVVQAFYAAFASRDPVRIDPFIHDEAVWMIVGPIDLLCFCGLRRGKAAVMELFERVVPSVLRVTGFDLEILLVDGDRAASFNRVTAIQRATGRTISYRCSQFLRFQDDKVIEFRSVIDSFDAAEQMLGHHIDLSGEAKAALAVV
jgi:ketosteroid isomerase-like protein